jgi:ADP-dependent NAD(P)H-hydrate dehydratase
VTATDQVALDAAYLRSRPLPLDEHGDKFDRGTALVIGGSENTPGAVLLAGIGALRMGAGRLQIATDAAVTHDVAVAMPEALVMPLGADASSDAMLCELVRGAQSVLVGPGLPSGADALAALELVLRHAATEATVVVDAAALQALPAIADDLRRGRRGRMIVTPNRQEAAELVAALTGDDPPAPDVVLETIAATLPAVVTSFGVVCAPDGRRWRAEDGGAGLSTSGSGDVLAGLAAGAAARTTDTAGAACWATFTHVAAARYLTARTGGIGFLARELADAIGPAIAEVMGRAVAQPG